MLSKKMEDALNKQINEELYSAYLYAAMVGIFESQNLKGFSQWMRLQVAEEMAHAQKFAEFIYERGGNVKLAAIKAPKTDASTPLDVFEGAYKHECHISGCINKLSTLAIKEEDHASRIFLEWFVTEQVEEESHADDMVQQLKIVDGNAHGLLMLDREAGQRAPGGGGEEPAA